LIIDETPLKSEAPHLAIGLWR